MQRMQLWTWLVWCCASALTAQPTSWRSFGLHEGLAADCIMDIAQDSTGNIWIATAGGLNRYDGNRMYTFTRSRQPEAGSLVANDLNKVWPDPVEPVVWIATQRDGLDAYNYRTGLFTHHQADGRPGCIVDNSVTSITPSRSGGIWLTSYMGGISHYDRKTQRFSLVNRRLLPSLVSDAMWCMLETEDSVLCVGHVRNGLSIINLRKRQVKNIPVMNSFPDRSPAEDGVRTLVKDAEGRLWLGTEKGLACLLPNTDKPVALPCIKGLVCHLNLMRDTLWISTRDMGLWRLALSELCLFSTDKEAKLSPADALQRIPMPCFNDGETALVRCALPDKSGNVWVGTDRKGVQVRLHEPPMFYREREQTDIRVLEQDTDGRIYTGTLSGGLTITHTDGQTERLTAANSRLENNSITALRCDSDGDLWIGNDMHGLYRRSHSDGTVHKVRLVDNDGGQTIYVWSIERWNGYLAVGTYQGLFLVKPDSEAFACYTEKNSPLPGQYVYSLLTDSRGNLWCGNALGGLTVLSPDMQCLLRLDKQNGLPEKHVISMLESQDGSIWAATEDGLVRIRHSAYGSPDIEVLREESGLLRPSIQAMTETPDGRLWCSTPDGLYIIKVGQGKDEPSKAILCYRDEPKESGTFRMNAALPLSAHRILWGGDGRLVMYTGQLPKGCLHNSFHASVSEDNGQYTLTLTVTDIALADKVEFRYQMDDGPWNEVGSARQVSLGSLSGGRHKLKVMPCLIANTETGSDADVVVLSVNVPFGWLPITLPILSVVVLCLICAFLIRRKSRRQVPPEVHAVVSDTVPPPVSVEPSTDSLSPANRQLLEKAESIIDNLMQEPDFDKNRLAQELCMSTSTLYRRLKSATGLSPNEYIRHRRLLRARLLLTEGHSVSETATLVGMSITYLGRCYKEEFGISPSEVHA